MLDRETVAAARRALGMEKESSAEVEKADAPTQAPAPKTQEPSFSPLERTQFARHGLDPDRLRFIRTLSALRQGMNLDRKLFEQALAGKLPADVLGGSNDEEGLESYA